MKHIKEMHRREMEAIKTMGSHDNFFSLIRKAGTKKVRPCLKCRTSFISKSAGNRMCCSCEDHNQRQPVRATYTLSSADLTVDS